MPTKVRNWMMGSTMPFSGTMNEASGVAHTTAEAATVGVNDHNVHMTGPSERPRKRINSAVPRDMHRTSTVKMAALPVSVCFVNITQTLSPAASPAGFVLAPILSAPDVTLRRGVSRHTSRTTGSAYRVIEARPVGLLVRIRAAMR
jgi:hypothetical protein